MQASGTYDLCTIFKVFSQTIQQLCVSKLGKKVEGAVTELGQFTKPFSELRIKNSLLVTQNLKRLYVCMS